MNFESFVQYCTDADVFNTHQHFIKPEERRISVLGMAPIIEVRALLCTASGGFLVASHVAAWIDISTRSINKHTTRHYLRQTAICEPFASGSRPPSARPLRLVWRRTGREIGSQPATCSRRH